MNIRLVRSLLSLLCLGASVPAISQGAPPPVVASPMKAQLRLAVEPADGNRALVGDRRTVSLPAGRSRLRFAAVASRLDVQTVQLAVLSGPGALTIRQVRYLHDQASKDHLLQRYIGQKVGLQRLTPTGVQTVEGILDRTADGIWILETEGGILVDPAGAFVLPKLPAPLVRSATLEWEVEAAAAGDYTLEARYVTTGIRWTSRYEAAVDANLTSLAFRCHVELRNDSGLALRQAQVKLLSGSLETPGRFYPLPGPVTLASGARREITLAATQNLSVKPDLVFYPAATQFDLEATHVDAVERVLRLRNDKEHGLGKVLPAGRLLVFGEAPGSQLGLTVLSSENLPASKPGERLWISLGDANGLTASRSQTRKRQLNPLTAEHTLQVQVTNQGSQEVEVTFIERLPINARITESSAPAQMIEPGLVQFKIRTPAKGEAKLTYVIEIKKPAAKPASK